MGKQSKGKEVFSTYLKCNGDIEVTVAEDGAEMFEIPNDYVWAGTEEEDGIFCSNCGEEIFYHNGEYICLNCERTYTEQELEDYCGCGIIHG